MVIGVIGYPVTQNTTPNGMLCTPVFISSVARLSLELVAWTPVQFLLFWSVTLFILGIKKAQTEGVMGARE